MPYSLQFLAYAVAQIAKRPCTPTCTCVHRYAFPARPVYHESTGRPEQTCILPPIQSRLVRAPFMRFAETLKIVRTRAGPLEVHQCFETWPHGQMRSRCWSQYQIIVRVVHVQIWMTAFILGPRNVDTVRRVQFFSIKASVTRIPPLVAKCRVRVVNVQLSV